MVNLRKWAAPVLGAVLLVILIIGVLNRKNTQTYTESITIPEEPVELLYGIESGSYVIEENEIRSGETVGQIFARYGVSAAEVDRLDKQADSVFSFRKLRAGNDYTVFLRPDSTAYMDYFVYEISRTQFFVIDRTEPDTIRMHLAEKEITIERETGSAEITSSLWNAMIANDMSPSLAMELSEIYAWSIDFFGLQKGDDFTVIYDQQYVDTVSIGAGMIWGAKFQHSGKTYYAIPFIQNGKVQYWDENGNSLRKALLKAPLKFSRISSTFSNSRLHPVLRIRRPHHGVDYAAPAGTPVVAVADGVITRKGYDKGGGNTLRIKHAGGLESGYLHLQKFEPGINVGTRVSQGQRIGYVGSTGLSTGPHLDFRIWQNGTPIDPLKVPSEPAEPIADTNRLDFGRIRDLIMAELNGTLADSLRVTSLDKIIEEPNTDVID